MKLKEAIEAHGQKTGPVCTVQLIHDLLDKADQTDLAECLANPVYTTAQIARALTAEGHPIKAGTVQRHRSGECSCDRR